jgi:ArsR family transcriptional regulator
MSDLAATVDLLHTLGDTTRVRLMCLLAGPELSVAELTQITDLPQSSVSTHLRRLRGDGLLVDRRVGSSTYYAVDAAMSASARRVWTLLREQLADDVVSADARRRDAVVRARGSREGWADRVAGEMERHYSPGRTWEATARGLLGLMHLGDVLDVGSGDGVTAELLAPRARSYACVDRSEKVIRAAAHRLERRDNVSFHVADMRALPFADESFDQVLMFNVLTCVPDPGAALAEAARVLRRGGDLAVVTLDAHEHAEVATAWDHALTGLAPERLRGLARAAGLRVGACEVTSRERKKPYFRVVSAFATRPPS